MKHSHSKVLSLVLALLASPVIAQEPPKVEKGAAQPQAEARKSAAELIEQLGDPGYRNRKAAEDALRALGKDALKDLGTAAENHDDPEVRWRARRLADRIERGEEAGGLRPRRDSSLPAPAPQWRGNQPGFGMRPDIDQMFDTLFQQLERDFQLDIPRHQFFNDDFFRDLQKQMREQLRGAPGQGADRSESMKMAAGPDGVRVEIQRKGEDGKIESKVYEAPDMDSFRAKYPEIAQRHFGGGAFQFRIGPMGGLPMDGWPMGGWNVQPLPQAQPRGGVDFWQQFPQADPAAGDRLGVQVTELGDEQREALKLDEGVGLHVESVVAGTLAEKLGIQDGDVVVEVAGDKVGSAQDVRAALQKVAAGETVKVTVARDGKNQTLEAKKPGRKADAETKAESGKLRKREIR